MSYHGSDAVNLRTILDGQRQRLADAEYDIERLERKLIEAKLDRDGALMSIQMAEELLAKEEAK